MSPDDAGSKSQDRRRARLSASLRENLKRRKTQQRLRAAKTTPGRSAEDESPTPGDLKS
jgi:hypothetical protein